MRKPLHGSAADRNHFAAGLVIFSKIVLLRFSIDHIEKKLAQVSVTGSRAHWFHNVELEGTAEARAQLAVAGETQFVAALTKMQVRHCPDKADALLSSRNLIIGSRPVCAK